MGKPFRTTLKLKTLEINTDTGLECISTESVEFNPKDKKKYIEQFNNAKKIGYIESGEFKDNIWVISNKKENPTGTKLLFPISLQPKVTLALKAFFLLLINTNHKDTVNAAKNLMDIIVIIQQTTCFHPNCIDKFIETISDEKKKYSNKVSRSFRRKMNAVFQFLSFYETEFGREYIVILNDMSVVKSQPRDIPPFEDILEFNDIIDNFFNNYSHELQSIYNHRYAFLREKFLPIYIWWHITLLIPMRPGEFIRLRTNCTYYDKLEDKYYIKIPRIKNNISVNGDSINIDEIRLQPLQITVEIYNLIEEYKKLHSKEDEKFLFNYNTYLKYLDEIPSKISQKISVYTDCLGTSRFNTLIRMFYKEIVKDIFQIDSVGKINVCKLPKKMNPNQLIKIQPGDTRHLAISNLIEYGENPLTIAELCNHDSIKSQESYGYNIEKFAVIKSRKLSLSMISKFKSSRENIDINIDLNEKNLEGKIALSKEGARKIKEGACKNRLAPFACTSIDCYFCDDCIPIIDTQNKAYMKDLTERHKKETLKELSITQETIRTAIKELSRDSIKLGNGKILCNNQLSNNYHTHLINTVSLKHRLSRVNAVEHLIQEFEAGIYTEEGGTY